MTSLGGHRRFLLLGVVVAAMLAAIAGCGESDEDAATSAAEEALTSTDPSSCTDLQTENYRRQIQLSMGDFAIEACQQELVLTAADSAEVTSIKVDGDTATVDVSHTGAAFDGQVISYEMVKEDGQWKLDLLAGFAEFDKATFARALDRLLVEAKDINPPGAECGNNQLKALSVEELEQLYTSGDFREYAKVYEPCS